MVHTRLPITFGSRISSLLRHCAPISRHGYGMWSVTERPSTFRPWWISWRKWSWPIQKIGRTIWRSWLNITRKSNNIRGRIFGWRIICSNGRCRRVCSLLVGEFSQVIGRSRSLLEVLTIVCCRDLFSDQNLLLDQCYRAILPDESLSQHWLLVVWTKGSLRNRQWSRLDGK